MSSVGASGVAMDRILVVPTRPSMGQYGRPVVAMQAHIPSYVARLREATVSRPRLCAETPLDHSARTDDHELRPPPEFPMRLPLLSLCLILATIPALRADDPKPAGPTIVDSAGKELALKNWAITA